MSLKAFFHIQASFRRVGRSTNFQNKSKKILAKITKIAYKITNDIVYDCDLFLSLRMHNFDISVSLVS